MDVDPKSQQRFLNYCRVLKLLTRGETQLHKIFRERWNNYCKLNNKVNHWNDDEASGKELIMICASAASTQKDFLQTGNVGLWDVTSANLAIQAVSKEIRRFGGQTDKNEDKMINALRELRNEITHGPKEFSDGEYEAYWIRLEDILAKFGEDVAEIKKLQEDLKELGHTKVIEIKSPDSKSEFNNLKEKANKFFKDEKYSEAIKIYDQVLKLPKLLPENQALIFSNRSISYLKMKDEKYLKMAKRDAEWAIQLWPCWWKGYYRLGDSQMKLRECHEAIKSFEKALALNPESREISDELSAARKEHGIISREEHFIPSQQPKSHDAVMKEISERIGIPEQQMKNMLKVMPLQGQYGDMYKAHQFRDGEGVPQDYTKAAAYFAKAADAGNPEGMYNLAQLYESGKGVKRDFQEALRWYHKAANGKALIMEGSGISEAQHSLGLKYTEGVGVEKNFKIAAEWYEKAVKNGSAASANNLAIFYKNGQGVERSLKKAFQYFKISAQRGDTAGMGNLADCYFAAQGTDSVMPTKADIAEGMKWLRIAARKGDLVAARELERRETLNKDEAMSESIKDFFIKSGGSGSIMTNPLDEKQFGKEVEEAAKKGSLIAKRQIEIWKNLRIAMEAFKENNPTKLVSSLSKAVRLDHQIVNIPDILHPIIQKTIQTHPNNIDAITCFISINTKNPSMPDYVFKYLEVFPSDAYLIEMCVASCLGLQNYDAAKTAAVKALQIHPQSLRFIYLHAIALCMQEKSTEECIKALDEFLALAPKDHDKVPACYYRKASYYMVKGQNDKFYESFKKGLEAEKDQLSCFLPYQFPMKDILMKIYAHQIAPGEEKNAEPDNKAERLSGIRLTKDFLHDPMRKLMITSHREMLISIYEMKNITMTNSISKPPNSPMPPRLTSLKSITLKDMDPTVNKVYDGYVLEANIIEWPVLMSSIMTVIQDENGDVQRLAIYKWPSKGDRKKDYTEALKTFRPNVFISIINPYMRIAQDRKCIIRVEDPIYIRIDDTSADQKCTLCGKEAKVLPCSVCNLARYCSKECQKVDWTELNHKGICKYLKSYSVMH